MSMGEWSVEWWVVGWVIAGSAITAVVYLTDFWERRLPDSLPKGIGEERVTLFSLVVQVIVSPLVVMVVMVVSGWYWLEWGWRWIRRGERGWRNGERGGEAR